LVTKANTSFEKAKTLKQGLPPEKWDLLWNSEKGLFSTQVFEALRKSKSSKDVLHKIKEYTGVDIEPAQAAHLYKYKLGIDALSPTFLDKTAEVLSFEHAHFGGLKSDFPVVGARNFEALAEALKDAHETSDGKGLEDLPLRLKRAEQKVTDSLNEQKEALKNLVNKVYSNVTCMKSAGDDSVTHFGCPVSRETKIEFLHQASKDPLLKNTRFAFFADDVKPDDRMGLSNHGEFLEKTIKSHLRQSEAFTHDQLKDFTMAIDLRGKQLWQGQIDLLLANESKLTDRQRIELDLALDRALQELASENKGKSNYSRASRFSNERVVLPPIKH
jgi:hypothetical protein